MTAEPETVVTQAGSRFGATRLYRDAGSMAVSNVANAILGMGFWALAAVMFPPEQLGVMTAILAVITATSVVLATGIGDAYTALLPAVGPARRSIYRRGQRVFMVLAAVTAVGAAIATTTALPQAHRSVAVGVLVAVGIVAWSAFSLQNSTLISLGRARWLPAANIAAGTAKIALLPAIALTLNWHSVELAFIVSASAVVLVLRPAIHRIINTGCELPTTATLSANQAAHAFNKLVTQTITSSGLSLGVLTVTPFLVTVIAGPAQGALFALSLTIVQILDMVAAALGLSLVVHASSTPEDGNAMARAILVRSMIIIVAGAVAIIAVVPVVLRLVNPMYGEMGAVGVIAALCAGSVIRVIYIVWSGLQRARRKMKMLLILNFITASMLLLIIPSLAGRYGALGGALAVLIPQTVLSAGAVVHFLATRRESRAMR